MCHSDRNCLSKWFHVGAAQSGVAIEYEKACEQVYGMPYKDWKSSYQTKASDEQLRRMEETKAKHAQHSAPPVVPSPALTDKPFEAPTNQRSYPTPVANGGMSNVCCILEEELQATGNASCAPRLPLIAPPSETVLIRLGVLTISDRAARGVYEDLSGPEIENCMRDFAASAAGKSWNLAVARKAVVADEAEDIRRKLCDWSDLSTEQGPSGACNLILTTGGTGLSPRDVTPEVTSSILERPTPGLTELLLRESVRVEPLAALSRAVAGIRQGTLIVNLPGRTKAVRENLSVLMPLLGHFMLAMTAFNS